MDDPRIEQTIAELKELILSSYPEACFEVTQGDDPAGVYLTSSTSTVAVR